MFSKMQDGSFIICGVLPKDAEYRQVGQKNSSLTKFSVKVGETVSAETDSKPSAVWTNCECWHSVARSAMNFKKGDTVLCVGMIVSNEYNGKIYKNLVCEFVIRMQPENVSQLVSEVSDLSGFEVLSDAEPPF